MAEVLAFPLSRRIGFIRKQARYVCTMHEDAAGRHIARQVQDQRERLISKGVDPGVASRLSEDLRGAIHAEIWRHVLTQGGGAA